MFVATCCIWILLLRPNLRESPRAAQDTPRSRHFLRRFNASRAHHSDQMTLWAHRERDMGANLLVRGRGARQGLLSPVPSASDVHGWALLSRARARGATCPPAHAWSAGDDETCMHDARSNC